MKPLRTALVLTLALGGALLLRPIPAFATWSQALDTSNGTNLPQGGSLNFDLILNHDVGSTTNTIGIGATAGVGVTADPAGPIVLSDANSPVTVPMVLRATASAPLGNQIVTVRTSEGATTRTSNFTITVVAGTPGGPPVISAVSWTFTSTSITVTWNTSYAANSKVDYGTTTAYGQSVSTLSTYSTTHRITLPGLTPNTVYHFHITSCSSSNSCNTSDPDRQQRTASASNDTTPPFMTNILISASSNQATISWDTTNEIADSQVEWGTTVTYGSAGSPLFDPTLKTNHTLVMTGLSPTTTYYYVITSKDAAGNSSNSGRGDVTHFFITVAPGQVDRIFTTGACTDPGTGNAIAIGQCSSGTPAQYCHSGGVLALDCTKCGYTCAAGQTCRADGTCADNPTPNAANPFQCNDAACYDANGVFISPAATNCYSAFPACNANTILKIRPDRICTQWLTPKTSVTLVDPQTRLKEELSLSLTSCSALDSAGRCSSLVQGDHCQLDPLRICKTDADCSGLGLCVPPAHCENATQACSTDSECGTGKCVSDNLTYFTPRDRVKFSFLTGSVNLGLNWVGGHCSTTTSKACNQNSDCGGSETCMFDPAYGRCSTDPLSLDYPKSCRTDNAVTACGAGKACLFTSISGRYPWDLNRQVGIAVPQINNSEFEEIEKAEVSGRTVTQFPTRPWQAYKNASIRVVVDPTLVGSTTAGSNHALEVSPSTDVDSGAFAPIGGFPVGPSQQYYLNIRLHSSGPQTVNVMFGASPNDPGGIVNTFDLSDTWTTKLIALDTNGIASQTYSVFVTCKAGASGDCSTNAFHIDDVFIQTALNVAFNPPDDLVVIPRSCRIFPREDSLTCEYTLNGVLYSGQHGYCLQKDPANDSICLSWWPVDIIAGDGNFFGGAGGYSDRTPLYFCLESRGTATTTGGTTGATSSAYLSPEVSNFTVTRVKFASELCNLSTGTRTGSAHFSDALSDDREHICPDSEGASSCSAACTDDGLLLGETVALTGTNLDAYRDDLQDIQVHSDTYAPGTYILSRENNWQFVACHGAVTACPETYDSVTGWSDQQIHDAYGPGVVLGAKAEFSDSGLLSTITYKFADGTQTGGTDPQTFSTKLHFKELCRKLAKVADGASTVPWASRVASRSYAVDTLLYKYVQDYAPYGGAVVPEDPNNPTTWTSGLNAEQPVTDDPFNFGSAPQYQSRSGSPYACFGNCNDRYCVGGKNNGTQCNSNPTICRTADSGGVQGVCQGVGPAAGGTSGSGASTKGFQDVVSNPDAQLTYFAEQRARRLFAQSLGIFSWTAQCIGGTTGVVGAPGTFCTQNSQCNSNVCKAGYFSFPTAWTPPDGLCGTAAAPNPALRDTFDPANDADYCAIAPTVSNLKVNGGSTTQIRNGASVTLTFNFDANAEQVPVQHIFVDWGDGETADFPKSVKPQTDPANPISFIHPYACANTTPCTYTIRVQVVDNWGWGSNPGATSRDASSNRTTANHTNWVTGPTVTVTP
jgi:hypothetical protein